MVFPRRARVVFLTEFWHCYFWLWTSGQKGRGNFKNVIQSLKKSPCFCFGSTNRHRVRKGLTLLCFLYNQTYFTSGFLVNSFQANLFSCAAIPAFLRVGWVLRNLSEALLFWGSGKRPFSTAKVSVMLTAMPLVYSPVCFPASLLSFTAYSPSHDDSFAFTVVKSHLRFCMHSYCTFCTLKTLKGWPWQSRD